MKELSKVIDGKTGEVVEMNHSLQIKKDYSPNEFSSQQIELIKHQIAKGFSDDQLQFALYTAKRMGLDPLAKQIYFNLRTDKFGKTSVQVTTSVDGYRLIADRTGAYAGSDEPVFDNEKTPGKATITVYKMVQGIRCPFTASARWEQYCPKAPNDLMWRKMPHLMLGKCAEVLALRKAFPAELSGAYTKEEMEQAEDSTGLVAEEEVPSNGGGGALNKPGAHLENPTKPAPVTRVSWRNYKTSLPSQKDGSPHWLNGYALFDLDHQIDKKSGLSKLHAQVQYYKDKKFRDAEGTINQFLQMAESYFHDQADSSSKTHLVQPPPIRDEDLQINWPKTK